MAISFSMVMEHFILLGTVAALLFDCAWLRTMLVFHVGAIEQFRIIYFNRFRKLVYPIKYIAVT